MDIKLSRAEKVQICVALLQRIEKLEELIDTFESNQEFSHAAVGYKKDLKACQSAYNILEKLPDNLIELH